MRRGLGYYSKRSFVAYAAAMTSFLQQDGGEPDRAAVVMADTGESLSYRELEEQLGPAGQPVVRGRPPAR